MDRSQDVLASLSSAVFAGLRAATAPGSHSRRDEESDGLLSMLSDPDFIPPPLRSSNEVRSHPPAAYDDLPPLEDEVELPSGSNASGADMPNQDDDGPPPLEPDDSLPVVTQSSLVPLDAPATSSSSNSSIAASSGIPASAQASVSRGLLGAPRASGRATSRPARAPVNAEDDGAESDSSLPSLQSVSDSSDEEDYISESGSEWDDDESLDDSEGEPDIARLVSEAGAGATEALLNSTRPDPPVAIGVLPDIGPAPNMFRNTLQSYRELLDRAVSRMCLVRLISY